MTADAYYQHLVNFLLLCEALSSPNRTFFILGKSKPVVPDKGTIRVTRLLSCSGLEPPMFYRSIRLTLRNQPLQRNV